MTLPTDLPVLAFPDQAALEAWLDAEGATAPGVYVRLAKKGSGIASVTYPELVESCLCFGWIDGRSNRLDEATYLQRITPGGPAASGRRRTSPRSGTCWRRAGSARRDWRRSRPRRPTAAGSAPIPPART